jgi:hypothetical protein
MEVIILVSLYLLGCIISYIYLKHIVMKVIGLDEWGEKDVFMTLMASLFSWIAFINCILIHFLIRKDND